MSEITPPYPEGPDRREYRMPILSVPEGMRNEVTGLPNEAALNLMTQDAVNRFPGQFGEIDLDLDGLAEHNTLYGHRDANQYLRYAGELMTLALRQDDTIGVVAHPHGDEFRILVAGVNTQGQVTTIVERLRSSLDQHGILASAGGRPHQVGETAEQLATAADNLMIMNKLERKKARYTPDQFQFIQDTIILADQRGISMRDMAFFAELL